MRAIIYGRDVVNGLPVEREVSTAKIDEALSEHFNSIINNIKYILERTPPELAADIYRNGLFLTGGGSLVTDFAKCVAKGTGLKVNLAEKAGETVILGISEIIKNKKFRKVTYSIERTDK